jgi:hypothetical protein
MPPIAMHTESQLRDAKAMRARDRRLERARGGVFSKIARNAIAACAAL